MLCRFLKQRGHVYDEAETGLMAVNMVKSLMTTTEESSLESEENQIDQKNKGKVTLSHYDAILMDFIMPTMNGPTATTKIRELG